MLEIEEPQRGPNGNQLIRNKAGKLIEIGSATIGPDKKPIFLDRAGKKIEYQFKPSRHLMRQQRLRNTFFIIPNGLVPNMPNFLVDLFGNVVDTKEGQAAADEVLTAQNNSLVYYMMHVNDVYAYFLTGTSIGGIRQHFPTTQEELDKIKVFAAQPQHGDPFSDPHSNPNALTIELKTSWVEAEGLTDQDKYIMTTALIPTYDKSNSNHWVQNGEKRTLLV